MQLEIDHLLFQLAWCIEDLHSFRQQLTLDDINQAEISLQKLDALIFNSSHKEGTPKLVAV